MAREQQIGVALLLGLAAAARSTHRASVLLSGALQAQCQDGHPQHAATPEHRGGAAARGMQGLTGVRGGAGKAQLCGALMLGHLVSVLPTIYQRETRPGGPVCPRGSGRRARPSPAMLGWASSSRSASRALTL